MKPHKWAKEIKAWADGAEIEGRNDYGNTKGDWHTLHDPTFLSNTVEYRIKPQPKEPQYLYAHRTNEGDITFEIDEGVSVVGYQYIGKIRLKVDDD